MKNELTFSLYLAFKKMQTEFHNYAAHMGLDAAPYSALLKLWRKDGLTITELGESLSLKTSTITSLIDRMERDGLVRRERDTDDRRVVKIYVTEKSNQLRGKFPSFEEYFTERLAQHFSPDEIETLTLFLVKIKQSSD